MYAAAFEYHRATSVQDAISLLERYRDEAKLLAGGHSLIPLMKLRFAQPKHLIDLRHVPGLTGIREAAEGVRIGALTTYHEMEQSSLLRRRVPVLAEAAARVGDLQVRNLGTIGGSLAHADPAADLPAVVLALDATLRTAGPQGERSIAADQFFLGLLATALGPSEVLTEVRIPAFAPRTGAAYEKQPHPASGYALCGVAAVVTLDAEERVERARVALTGVASKPTRAGGAEAALVGAPATAERMEAAVARVTEGVDMRADEPGAEGYNAQLLRVCARRALEQALARARK